MSLPKNQAPNVDIEQLSLEVSKMKQGLEADLDKLKESLKWLVPNPSQPLEVVQYCWQSRELSVSGTKDLPCIEVLRCPPMESGLHRWNILIEEECDGLEVGILDTRASAYHLAHRKLDWAYSHDGIASDESSDILRSGLPKFQKGSRISMFLKLTKGPWGIITLSASVDGGNVFRLCNYGQGRMKYRPAVRLTKPGKVRFLGLIESDP
jgi:hypothetical protein